MAFPHNDAAQVAEVGASSALGEMQRDGRPRHGAETASARIAAERARHGRRIDDLVATNLELERALAVKDEFLGLLSHELKTPITTIAGNLALALRRELPLDAAELLADAQVEAERLAGIIDNLLVIARGVSDRGVDAEPVRLDTTINDAIAWLARSDGRVAVRVSGERRVVVEAHEAQLTMVLRNFLSNAAKYGGSGEIGLSVAIRDAMVIVTVSDQGPGILAADRERVFEAFYRCERTARTATGLGAGLAVCRRVAEAMGGRCYTAPGPSGGSEFSLEVPLAMAGEKND